MSEQNQEATRTPPMRPLLRVREVAARLGVSVATVWRMVQRGELPAVRLTRAVVRFHQADVERLLEKAADASPSGT